MRREKLASSHQSSAEDAEAVDVAELCLVLFSSAFRSGMRIGHSNEKKGQEWKWMSIGWSPLNRQVPHLMQREVSNERPIMTERRKLTRTWRSSFLEWIQSRSAADLALPLRAARCALGRRKPFHNGRSTCTTFSTVPIGKRGRTPNRYSGSSREPKITDCVSLTGIVTFVRCGHRATIPQGKLLKESRQSFLLACSPHHIFAFISHRSRPKSK